MSHTRDNNSSAQSSTNITTISKASEADTYLKEILLFTKMLFHLLVNTLQTPVYLQAAAKKNTTRTAVSSAAFTTEASRFTLSQNSTHLFARVFTNALLQLSLAVLQTISNLFRFDSSSELIFNSIKEYLPAFSSNHTAKSVNSGISYLGTWTVTTND